jgi:hypothetical protein
MIIREKGLLEGKRLRKCSPRARLFWPFLFAMSNGYARLELDYELLEDKLHFFRDEAPDAAELHQFCTEFENNHLMFLYEVKGQIWGQWDTRAADTKDYKTAADKESPAPPEEDYLRWLCERHGEDWMNYHCNQRELEKHLPEDFIKVLQKVSETFAVGVGSGKGFGSSQGKGNGQGRGQEVTSTSTSSSTNQPSATSSKPINQISKTLILQENSAEENCNEVLLDDDHNNSSPGEGYNLSSDDLIAEIRTMVDRYPRACPLGKVGEWKSIFFNNIMDLADNPKPLKNNLVLIIKTLNRVLDRFIKSCKESGTPNIVGPEKFFEKWVYADFMLKKLRQKAGKEDEVSNTEDEGTRGSVDAYEHLIADSSDD